jgi:uncharacterized membrane protein
MKMKKSPGFEKLLAPFFVFILLMVITRMLYSGSIRFAFLLWNLFLAWIPLQISVYLSAKKFSNKWQPVFLLAGWLLFFPNALYIVTDLIHLDGKTNVPTWYDAILLFTSSIAGLIMAFVSLYRVEIFLSTKLNQHIVNRIVIVCLFLGSFGVYLGRFARLNSWNIFTNPFDLAIQITIPFILPLQHYRAWAVTILLTCLFCLIYFTIKKLPGNLKQPGNIFLN